MQYQINAISLQFSYARRYPIGVAANIA